MELSAQQASQNGDMVSVARLKKFAMLAVYVYVVFLVCYLPATCFLWIISFTPEPDTLTDLFQGFSWTLVFLNSTLNPLIYCYKIGTIRLTIMNMLRNVFCKHHWSKANDTRFNIVQLLLIKKCWTFLPRGTVLHPISKDQKAWVEKTLEVSTLRQSVDSIRFEGLCSKRQHSNFFAVVKLPDRLLKKLNQIFASTCTLHRRSTTVY